MAEAIHKPAQAQAEAGLTEDARKILEWLRARHGEGRPRTYSAEEIARGVFGKTDGPAPGMMFDPQAWPRLMQALELLEARALVEEGRLPQGDPGYHLVTEVTRRADRGLL